MGGQTSSLRVSGSGEVAMGTNVEGAVLAIVTCARAPKALGEGRDDRTIVSELHDERMVDSHSIFIKAVFGVNGSKGGGSVGRSWGG